MSDDDDIDDRLNLALSNANNDRKNAQTQIDYQLDDEERIQKCEPPVAKPSCHSNRSGDLTTTINDCEPKCRKRITVQDQQILKYSNF
ncbi:hypothetical protein FNV43_RR05779 [Rhamnella rubrinervis]|uniref:Uncharacterized protein n=1 Tax=Rhamnella rubrinervis TaxID=2594499 RepID=A0A8K0MQR6_9ROSA|nr:hypothetical protein FNV43_RR05779 [Rhamnella rubrinervis]